MLDEITAGRWLRQQREQHTGKWQGPLGVPPGSVVICMALGSSPADDLATEVLVRLLRGKRVDARHFSPADIDAGLPPGADPDGVSIAFLVSAFPSPGRENADVVSQQLHKLLPQANLIRVFCPGVAALGESSASDNAEPTVGSLERRSKSLCPVRSRGSSGDFTRCIYELRGFHRAGWGAAMSRSVIAPAAGK